MNEKFNTLLYRTSKYNDSAIRFVERSDVLYFHLRYIFCSQIYLIKYCHQFLSWNRNLGQQIRKYPIRDIVAVTLIHREGTNYFLHSYFVIPRNVSHNAFT